MAKSVSVKIDTTGLDAKIRRLSALQKKDLPLMVKQSARRVAVNLARGTAPFGDTETGNQAGEKAVSRDVARTHTTPAGIAVSLQPEDRRRWAWLLNNSTPSKINSFLKKLGITTEWRRTANVQRHRAHRRRGSVPRLQQADIVAPKESIERMATRISKRVGLAKHGWAICARVLGGVRGIPKWVTRSKGKPQAGRVTETKSSRGITFILQNLVPYVSNVMNRATWVAAIKREENFLAQQIGREITRKGK